jgi:cell division protein FtsL
MEIGTQKTNRYSRKIKAVLWVLFIFTALFLIIYRYGEMIDLNYDIYTLNDELAEKRAINSSLYAELDKKMNITQIKYLAQTKLDMNEPRQNQMIYIDVDMADSSYSQEKDDFYAKMTAVFNRIKHTFEKITDIFTDTKNQ